MPTISGLRFFTPAPAIRHFVLGGALSLVGNSCTPDFGRLSAGQSGTFSESAGDSASSGASGCSGVDCAGAANDAPQGGSAAGSGQLPSAGRGGVGAAGGARGGSTAGNGPKGGAAGADKGGVAAGTDTGGVADTSGAAAADTGGVAAGGAASGTDSGGFSGNASNEVDLPGTASADSEESFKGNGARSGHDDNPLTRWCAADGLPGHFWTLDLGAGHALSRLEVLWEYPYGANPSAYYLYTVSVSDDALSFTQVIDKSANNDSTADQVVLFPAATSARYVRITVTGLPPPLGPSSPYWASFFELHVFGPAAP